MRSPYTQRGARNASTVPHVTTKPDLKAAHAEERATASGVTPQMAARWQQVADNYRLIARYVRVFGKWQQSDRERSLPAEAPK